MDFSPHTGHEQGGRRPALVLTDMLYNRQSGRMLCCPITSRVRGYPFDIPLTATRRIYGMVLADQVRAIDWRAREVTLADRAEPEVLIQVAAVITGLLPTIPRRA